MGVPGAVYGRAGACTVKAPVMSPAKPTPFNVSVTAMGVVLPYDRLHATPVRFESFFVWLAAMLRSMLLSDAAATPLPDAEKVLLES